MTNFQKSNGLLLVFGDLMNLSLTFYISLYFFRIQDHYLVSWDYFLLFLLIFLWLIIASSNNLYTSENQPSLRLNKYLKTYIILAGIIGLIYLVFSLPLEARNFLLSILIGIPILGLFTNLLIIRIYRPIQVKKHRLETTLIAGVGNLARKVEKCLEINPRTKNTIQGFIDCSSEKNVNSVNDRIVTRLEYLKEYLSVNYADEIIIALPFQDLDKIKTILNIADYHGARVRFVPDYLEVFGEKSKSYHFGDLEIVNIRELPLDSRSPKMLKNGFDILFSIFALLSVLPLFAIIAAVIKLESPGPVFYTPKRIGKNGKPFFLFKFRTMKNCDDPINGNLSTVEGDTRVTRIGKLLRKYSIDELPQFINVLIGDMSVIGPRPHRTSLNQMMQSCEDKYMVRHYCKPGITGWAQVNGWRGPLVTTEQKKQRTEHDLWYLKNWSLWLDIKIVYLTVFGKKTHKNAF